MICGRQLTAIFIQLGSWLLYCVELLSCGKCRVTPLSIRRECHFNILDSYCLKYYNGAKVSFKRPSHRPNYRREQEEGASKPRVSQPTRPTCCFVPVLVYCFRKDYYSTECSARRDISTDTGIRGLTRSNTFIYITGGRASDYCTWC